MIEHVVLLMNGGMYELDQNRFMGWTLLHLKPLIARKLLKSAVGHLTISSGLYLSSVFGVWAGFSVI